MKAHRSSSLRQCEQQQQQQQPRATATQRWRCYHHTWPARVMDTGGERGLVFCSSHCKCPLAQNAHNSVGLEAATQSA